MLKNNQFWTFALAYGAAQGLFLFFALLLSPRGRRLANALLAAMMLWSTIHTAHSLLVATGLITKVPWIFYVSMVLGPAVGPLYYFYTKSLLAPGYKPNALIAAALIVVPGLLYLAPFVASPFGPKEWAQWFLDLRDCRTIPIDLNSVYIGALLMLYLAVFLVLTWRYIGRVKQDIGDCFGREAGRYFVWLRILGSGLGLYAVIVMAFLIKMVVTFEHSITERYMFSLTRSLIIQFTAISVFFLPEAFSKAMNDLAGHKKRACIDDETAEKYLNRFKEYMETEKPYRNPDLRLPDLARDLSTTPQVLSQIINERLHTNFSDFINKYRVDEIRIKLQDESSDRYTLLAIARESGFSSKTSFYRAFKKYAGMSASEYRARLRTHGHID